jgi:hypothetical protein
VLKDAVDHKMSARGSNLLEDPMGDNQDRLNGSDLLSDLGPRLDQVVANMQQFEADSQALQLQLRAQYTLDAMNALAHYLQNFPGRKNLIWFSGSFPISILPNPNIANGFSAMQLNAEEFRETTNLLAKARGLCIPWTRAG